MAKLGRGQYRWGSYGAEGRMKILRALRKDARLQVEEALAEVERETGSGVDDTQFEDIVDASAERIRWLKSIMQIIDREFREDLDVD